MSTRRLSVLVRRAFLVLTLSTVLGCSVDDIDSVYGKRRGAKGEASVNGTGVLATLFEQAGHRVTSRRMLAPKMLQTGDIIVWAPDEFAAPSDKQRQFFENWLRSARGRTLIYIGRDYDAGLAYWEHIQPQAPPEQAVEIMRRLAQTRARHTQARHRLGQGTDLRWFRFNNQHPARFVGRRGPEATVLRGPWNAAGDLDPSQLDIRLQARLEPPDAPPPGDFDGPFRDEVLLAAGDEVLVRRISRDVWFDSQVIAVVNGSFLLNLPLVEKEHRKLAAKLIAACGPPGKAAVFLESGEGGPPVLDKDPGTSGMTGFEAFTTWPLGAILLHFVTLALLYLLARMAIFGRPQELAGEAVSDFGRHIGALGELLARKQAHEYARQRLAYYHEKVKRESGTPPSGVPKTPT